MFKFISMYIFNEKEWTKKKDTDNSVSSVTERNKMVNIYSFVMSLYKNEDKKK